jgi:SWI/SNF-related matrix-associated actin-dependent regulator of chromatin subfamily A3
MVSVPSTSFTPNLSSSPGQSAHTVIDLTSSRSPSPAPRLPPALPQPPQFLPSTQLITFESASLRTPVCIGRLDVTALILYPSTYLEISISEPSTSDPVWGPVRLQYERTPHHHPGSEDTVHIKTPNRRGPLGEIHPGEDFAIVEQRVASILGPMLGKGLIRVDSRIRKGNRHVRILCSAKAFVSCERDLHSSLFSHLRSLYIPQRVTSWSSETFSASLASFWSTRY